MARIEICRLRAGRGYRFDDDRGDLTGNDLGLEQPIETAEAAEEPIEPEEISEGDESALFMDVETAGSGTAYAVGTQTGYTVYTYEGTHEIHQLIMGQAITGHAAYG